MLLKWGDVPKRVIWNNAFAFEGRAAFTLEAWVRPTVRQHMEILTRYTGGVYGNYILALAEVSTVWSDALASWTASGTNSAILIRSANNFAADTGDPTCDFALEADNGSLIFGTQTASSITSAAIPEPSVSTLLVLGALGLGALRLRRQTV